MRRREMREELGNLGIYDFELPAAAFEAADVPGACDDNFAVNRWNGEGHVWAVTPRCFLLKTDARTLERLQGLSEKGRREAFSEARGFCKIRLTEALSRFGKKGGAEVSEDGRDMASDYRYPHEWMVLWILAARELRHDEKLLVSLAGEVQAACAHRLDLFDAADRMRVGTGELAAAFGVSPQTVKNMQENMNVVWRQKCRSEREECRR